MSLFSSKQVVYIDGMMCEHCAKHVSEALLKLANVKSVKVDLKGKKALLKVSEPLDEDSLKKVIEEIGYTYKGKE